MCIEGKLWFFLRLQIKQTLDGIFLNQSKFEKDLVSKFGLSESKPLDTPINSNEKITKDIDGVDVDSTEYRSIIRSVLYFTASRLDISFSVGACESYQATPKESHLKAAKRIIRYVHGAINFSLWYPFDTTLVPVEFLDDDWAGNVDDHKTTSGGCFYVGNCLVSWHSHKQNSKSLSTVEAKYIAIGSGCTQLLWMNQMLANYDLSQDTMNLFVDNSSAI